MKTLVNILKLLFLTWILSFEHALGLPLVWLILVLMFGINQDEVLVGKLALFSFMLSVIFSISWWISFGILIAAQLIIQNFRLKSTQSVIGLSFLLLIPIGIVINFEWLGMGWLYLGFLGVWLAFEYLKLKISKLKGFKL